MKHTFESVLPLFVAALGEPTHKFDDDEVREYEQRAVSWDLGDHGDGCHVIMLTEKTDVLGVVARGAIDPATGGCLTAAWVLSADDAAAYGDPVATPEEALRLAREWAKVPP